MPTVAELERLDALVKRLTPLTNLRRGELIRADDWNTIVGALIEVARAVLAEEREAVVPDHEHPDQVSVGWLDPRLRELIERGPLSDPEAAGRLRAVERRITDLRGSLQSVSGELKENRERIADVSTRDLERAAAVTAVRRAVDGLSDAREDVRAVRQTLGAIEKDVKVAVELSSRLMVGGELVDMAEFDRRLGDVEELRERLRMPDGMLLDASSLELRLTALTNTLVTEEELDAAFEARRARLDEAQVASLQETLRADLQSQLTTSVGELETDIRQQVSARLAEINAQVARAVSDALPGVHDSVLAAVRPEISAAAQRTRDESRAEFEVRLGELDATLRQDLGGLIDDVQRGVAAAVRTEFERQLPAQLDPLRSQLSDLVGRLDRAEAVVRDHTVSLKTLGARVEELGRRVTDFSQVAARVDELSSKVADFPALLSQEISALKQEIPNMVATHFESFRPVVAQLISKTVDERMPGIVRLEVNRALRDRGGGTTIRDTAVTPTAPADFTVLRGIGDVGNKRLIEAGIRTFAELAARTPEELGAILGISSTRVRQLDLIGQARGLARRRPQ